MKPLTEDQLHFFSREGYLVIEGALDDADLQPVIDEIDEEINSLASKLKEQGKLSRAYDEYGFETRLAHISRETDEVARSLWNGTLCGSGIFGLIINPKLLDVAEQFVGPEIIASSVYRLRPKIPDYGYGAVPWHQDSGYFEPYCDTALVLTFWIPLIDATEERGCMWVLPRAHTGKVVQHTVNASHTYLEIPEEVMPPGERVILPMKKGDILLLHNLTPHASFENRSNIVRWSMDLRYQAASLPTNAAIDRIEGDSVPDLVNGVPMACYPPEADFLARSALRPNQVVRDHQKFEKLRREHISSPVTSRWS